MKVESVQILIADEGMIIAKKSDGEILSEKVYLATGDAPKNYIEVEKTTDEPLADEPLSAE